MMSSIADSLLCTMQGKTLAHRRRYARCSLWGSAAALQMAPAEGVAQHIPAGFARIETGARQALRARRCRVWGGVGSATGAVRELGPAAGSRTTRLALP